MAEGSDQVSALRRALFVDPRVHVYCVLDGASVPKLRKRLAETGPPHYCLFRGELSPDMAEVAPYVVELGGEEALTDWILRDGFGRHWGIFAQSDADLRTLRTHFRNLLTVRDPEGKELHFRYYDPRVFRVFLPTCTPGQLAEMFGPVTRYLAECPKGEDEHDEFELVVFDAPR